MMMSLVVTNYVVMFLNYKAARQVVLSHANLMLYNSCSTLLNIDDMQSSYLARAAVMIK